MAEKEVSDLEKLKKQYDIFKEKYSLPEFYELNKIFDIEEADVETDFLLRGVRRIVSERISIYLRFIETVLNPANAPLFFFKIVKKLGVSDKEKLNSIYDRLGKIEIEVLGMDIDYNEKKEAEFIKKMYLFFEREIKTEFLKIVSKLGNGEDNHSRDNNSSYCG